MTPDNASKGRRILEKLKAKMTREDLERSLSTSITTQPELLAVWSSEKKKYPEEPIPTYDMRFIGSPRLPKE